MWRPQANLGYHTLGAVYLLFFEPRSLSGTWGSPTALAG